MNQETEISNPKGLTEGQIVNTEKGEAKFIRYKAGNYKEQNYLVQIGRTEIWMKPEKIKVKGHE